MPPRPRLVTAGRVGRPHGLDGSFYVEAATHELAPGTVLNLGGIEREVERRAGTEERPLVRLRGINDREAAAALRGELLLISEDHSPLGEGEWLASDLEGCVIPGLGKVSRVLGAPSCDLLELDDGTLIPLVSDAVRSIDVERGRIDIDPDFLGEKTEEA